MNGRTAKSIRRKVRQETQGLLAQSLKATVAEPWPVRLQTGLYIITGGKRWTARLFAWAIIALTVWNCWMLVH